MVKKQKEKIKFCPKCKSKDVEIRMSTGIIFGMPQQWRCNKCGYMNYVFPEMEVGNEKNKTKKSK